MKDPKNDSTPVLERFGRDKRKRTVVATAERVERRPRLQRDAADSEQPSFENRPERRASYNPHFTADNRPVFEKPHYGDKSRGEGDRPRRSYDDRPRPYGDRQRQYDDKPRSYGDRQRQDDDRPRRSFGDKPRYDNDRSRNDEERPRRSYGDKPAYGEKKFGPKKFGDKPYGEKKSFGDRKPYGEKKSFGDRKPYERRDRYDRRLEMADERPAPSYRDSEYRPVAVAPVMAQPVAEEAVQENLLAGRNPIREALKAGRDIEKLLVQKGELTGSAREIVQMAKEAHIPVQEVEHQRLNELAKNHQGMVAFASAYQYSTVEAMLAEAEEKGEEPFLILLDGITDPHNLGAIIRSAECVGAHGVIVPERRAVGLTPAAVKASAGAIEHIKVARVVNMTRVIEMLKARNIWTYALTMDGTDYEKVNFKGGVALVVGSEGEGISHLVLENCDQKVSLPMAGHLDSLNASVAAGVVMYRVLSSRRA